MKKIIAIIAMLSLLLLSSCQTKYVVTEKEVPIEKTRVEYRTNIKFDSIYIHDSISVYSKGDTIFKDKIKLVFKDRLINDTIHVTDSIEKPVYIKTTETIKAQKHPIYKFLDYSGIAAWLCVIFFLTRKIKIKKKKD